MINPLYKWLAGIVAVLAIVGVIYGKGHIDAKHSAEIANLKSELKTATDTITRERAARATDAANAAAAQARLGELNSRITNLTEYANALQDRDRECLSGADTDRLRDLWR